MKTKAMDVCHLLDINDSENISPVQGKKTYKLVRPLLMLCYTLKIQDYLANHTSSLNLTLFLTLFLQQILFFFLSFRKEILVSCKNISFTCGDFWFLSGRNQTALKRKCSLLQSTLLGILGKVKNSSLEESC